MKPDVRAFLADALDAANGISKRLNGVASDGYAGSEDLRLMVERLYITLAEALRAAAKLTRRSPRACPIFRKSSHSGTFSCIDTGASIPHWFMKSQSGIFRI